ncbi:hypothetical protein DUI87_23515 [Hirundo rustica rustica]|uniref:Uncharacterized protein n=1 Tax=Hirundo rustica rustica TaxID=333673 RepID=A0A3M0JHF5_HIRRU|nr:hypothetical protein DUI87_23515 [Hirundo rustica rustica]
MLFMRMDLLNYQYLDKMNNNIGILCYEAPITLEKLYGILSSESHELQFSLASSRSLHKFFVVKTLQESSI